MTAKEAAEVLGVDVRRLYQLKAKLGGAEHGKQGILFDRALVIARKQRLGIAVGGGGGSSHMGSVAALVFQELQAGKAPVTIVIEQRIAPDVVRELAEQHAELCGSIVLTKAHLEAIYRMPGTSGITDCKSASDFLLLYEDSVKPPESCAVCRQRPAKTYVTPKARAAGGSR